MNHNSLLSLLVFLKSEEYIQEGMIWLKNLIGKYFNMRIWPLATNTHADGKLFEVSSSPN